MHTQRFDNTTDSYVFFYCIKFRNYIYVHMPIIHKYIKLSIWVDAITKAVQEDIHALSLLFFH